MRGFAFAERGWPAFSFRPKARPLQFPCVLRCALAALLLGALAACSGSVSRETYMKVTQNLGLSGKLRIDRAPADAPFTADDLATTFRSIAFSYEFQFRNGEIVHKRLDRPLKRWGGVIRYRLMGDGVTATDRRDVAELMAELTDLTGLIFRESQTGQDLLISIATPEGEDAVTSYLANAGLKKHHRRYKLWRRTPQWICGATLGRAASDRNRLVFSHVFLSDTAKGRLRRSCLHEEITQSLGLTNDNPKARPSIFNDDQEFALLTEHDAILLQILYDPSLQPGMEADEAMPIVRRLAIDHMRRRSIAQAPAAG